jgi:hypothetical protein
MSVSPNLMYAILAMDAYNRGYNPGIAGLSEASDGTVQIGTATITKNLEDAQLSNQAIAAGFYAVAYEWNGETIISYRGTDVCAGFRPGRRGPFVAAKGPKTIAALSWPFGFPARFADSGGAQTRCAHTVRACSPKSAARLGPTTGLDSIMIHDGRLHLASLWMDSMRIEAEMVGWERRAA